MIQPLWRILWRVLKELGIKLLYDPAIPVLGKYPEKTMTGKNTHSPMFTATLFTMARTWKQPGCASRDEWIKKLWFKYTVEYYSAMKRNKFESAELRWMNHEPVIQNEINQKEKNKIK